MRAWRVARIIHARHCTIIERIRALAEGVSFRPTPCPSPHARNRRDGNDCGEGRGPREGGGGEATPALSRRHLPPPAHAAREQDTRMQGEGHREGGVMLPLPPTHRARL